MRVFSLTTGYTGAALKAYKSLEGYKFFIAGWVKAVLVTVKQSKFVFTSKVRNCFYFTECIGCYHDYLITGITLSEAFRASSAALDYC